MALIAFYYPDYLTVFSCLHKKGDKKRNCVPSGDTLYKQFQPVNLFLNVFLSNVSKLRFFINSIIHERLVSGDLYLGRNLVAKTEFLSKR